MYNEEDALSIFFETVQPILERVTPDYEILCVNDGSQDDTLTLLLNYRLHNDRIKIIDLSRNFGKEQALSAGLDHATGDVVIPLDADLQDPPHLIPEMVQKWREDYDVVLAVRQDRDSDSLLKRVTATGFYKLFDLVSDTEMPANVGDYRLMDRQVINALKQLPERNRFMKGLFAWLGFRQAKVYFSRPSRAAGNSKWNTWKLWNFALDGIFSFSIAPLRVWTYIGLLLSVIAMLYMLYIVADALFVGNPVAGYPSLIAIILFFNGVIMIGMGILGEYVGRIFLESKQRPVYLVRSTEGLGGTCRAHTHD
jgi:glycosyltransferase involved in cell wall biosynthesis